MGLGPGKFNRLGSGICLASGVVSWCFDVQWEMKGQEGMCREKRI